MTQTPRMLEQRMVFGVREDVNDGILYLDDTNIVWVAGKSLIVLDTQLGTQEIVPCSTTCETVTSLAITLHRQTLAVAEGGRGVCIVIYSFDATSTPKVRRKKVLQMPDLGAEEFVSMCFSRDGRHLISLGGFPEWNLVYWNVEKAKVVSSCRALDNISVIKDRQHLNKCTISPSNSNLMCVTGKSTIRFFKLSENHLHALSDTGMNDDKLMYTSHIWLPDEDGRLIVSTNNGDLLLFERQEYKFILPLCPSDGLSITSLIAYSKGFVCGGDMGLITIYERTDNAEMYRKIRTFRFSDQNDGNADHCQTSDSTLVLPLTTNGRNYNNNNNNSNNVNNSKYNITGDYRTATERSGLNAQANVVNARNESRHGISVIKAFALTPPPAEEYLAFLTSTKQIYCINLPNAVFVKGNDRIFQPVSQPFHSGPITGVDCCAQRPLVVTAGRDKTIILWNTLTNSVVMRKKFLYEILSIAIHPSGLSLLVGFTDALKLFNIYDRDLGEEKTINIRACAACCFSSGGQFFAAMHASTIHIYYTYTCELLGHLRGHNGKVKSISFVAPHDTRLISCGTDGTVYEFNLCDFHKANDHTMKAITYHCASADVNTVWAAGNDRKLRQLDRRYLSTAAEYDLVNASMICMTVSQRLKLLFGGCEDGTIRVFNTYLGEKFNVGQMYNNSERVERGGGGGGINNNNKFTEDHHPHQRVDNKVDSLQMSAFDNTNNEASLHDSAMGDNTNNINNSIISEKSKLKKNKIGKENDVRDITIEIHETHYGLVNRLVLSHDESMLVSVGEDGLVVFWDVVAPHRNVGKEIDYCTELLMDLRELEKNAQLLKHLQVEVSELHQRMLQQQQKRERVHEEQLAKVDKEYGEEMQRQRAQIEQLETEKSEQAIRFTEYLTELDNETARLLEQAETDYDAKLSSLKNRSLQLRKMLQEENESFEAKRDKLLEIATENERLDARSEETVLRELNEQQESLMKQKETCVKETEEMCALIEVENDTEMNRQKEQFEKRKREHDDEINGIDKTNSILFETERVSRAEAEIKLQLVKEKLHRQTLIETQIETAKRDIQSLTVELRDRGDVINDKDRRISELKDKNEDLKKFKFVLEYKIKELKAEIAPIDSEIAAAKEKLTHMEDEKDQFERNNENLILQIRNLRQKRTGQQKEIDNIANKLSLANDCQIRLWAAVSEVHDHIGNYKELKKLAKSLFDKYAIGESASKPLTMPSQVNSVTYSAENFRGKHNATHLARSSKSVTAKAIPQVHAKPTLSSSASLFVKDELNEYSREREHLERNFDGLQRQLAHDAQNHCADKERLRNENMILVREINELRKEARFMATKAGILRGSDPHGTDPYEEEFNRELHMQRAELRRLQELATKLEDQLHNNGIPLPTTTTTTTIMKEARKENPRINTEEEK